MQTTTLAKIRLLNGDKREAWGPSRPLIKNRFEIEDFMLA